MARCMGCDGTLICLFFVFSFTFGLFLMPVLVALFASPYSPFFSVNLFYNQTLNMGRVNDSPTNLTIPFHLKLRNANKAVGIHYPDTIHITFSYFPNVSFLVVLAEYKLNSFYQGNGKTKHVRDMVKAKGVPTVLEGTNMIAFRVDLVGSYRYKKVGSKRHKVELGCLVGVDSTTNKKMQTGFISLVEPGHDSKLKKRSSTDSDD